MNLTEAQYNELVASGIKSADLPLNEQDREKMHYFAEACYDMNTFDDVRGFATDDVDETDCEQHGMTEAEWRGGQKLALQMAMERYEDENDIDA